MTAATHPEAKRYLKELDRALDDLPRARRQEIVAEISDHIEEATSPDASEVRVRTVLDELGDPETIAADARDRFGVTKPKGGTLEGLAIVGLLLGGIILPLVGWLIGAILLWISRMWTLRDKVIGTFVLPGGLALPAFLFIFSPVGVEACTTIGGSDGTQVSTCSTQPLSSELWGLALMVGVTLLPIVTAIYLARRAFR